MPASRAGSRERAIRGPVRSPGITLLDLTPGWSGAAIRRRHRPARRRSLSPRVSRAARRRHRAGAVGVRGRLSLARAHAGTPRTAARCAGRDVRDGGARRIMAKDSHRAARARTRTGFLGNCPLPAAPISRTGWRDERTGHTGDRRRQPARGARAGGERFGGTPRRRRRVALRSPCHRSLGSNSTCGRCAARPRHRQGNSQDDDRFHRMNRYAWEGTFFLLVLIGAMSVVYAALREEHTLRRQQEDFLASASHELKSPLASLRLSAETMAMRDPPPRRRSELVQRLLSDLGRLDQMIANMLDASRLSRGSVRVSRERVDLAPLVATWPPTTCVSPTIMAVTIFADVHADVASTADRAGVRTTAAHNPHSQRYQVASRFNARGTRHRACHARRAGRVTAHVEDIGNLALRTTWFTSPLPEILTGSKSKWARSGLPRALGLWLVPRPAGAPLSTGPPYPRRAPARDRAPTSPCAGRPRAAPLVHRDVASAGG